MGLTVQCACGCGQDRPVSKNWHTGQPVRFVNGHNTRKYSGNVQEAKTQTRKAWRRRNPEKVASAKRNFYRKRKLMAMEVLGNRCVSCSLAYDGKNAPVFEFDHTDPSVKEAQISRMLLNAAWDKIVQELSKCRLLCANCHNIRHGGEW